MLAVISVACLAMALAGGVSTLFEIAAVRAFARTRIARDRAAPNAETDAPAPAAPAAAASPFAATILKPLHGAEPGLYENLLSFITQDHAGPTQLVFGVADASDPAAAVVRRLQGAFTESDIALVVTGPPGDGNAKIANLVGMSAAIRHPSIVMSDSDIRVDAGYLSRTLAQLSAPGVGLVTCLYRGESAVGAWSLLAAMAIDYHFFPSVLLGLRVGRAHPCVGATMAFSAATLASIGGFAAFSRHLADDHAMGAAVRRTGRRVAVADALVEHRCLEASARQLVLHELRWARTVRAIDPWGFAGSVATHPLPFALAAAVLRGFDAVGSAALVAAFACRWALQWQVDRAVRPGRGMSPARYALGPLRDMLSFAIFLASFLHNAVAWRGRRYRIRADGTMAELKDASPLNRPLKS